MINTIIDFSVLTCAIVFISQILKTNFSINQKHIPLINLILGLILSTIFITDLELADRLLQGLVIGMSAGGMYDVCTSYKKLN